MLVIFAFSVSDEVETRVGTDVVTAGSVMPAEFEV